MKLETLSQNRKEDLINFYIENMTKSKIADQISVYEKRIMKKEEKNIDDDQLKNFKYMLDVFRIAILK